MTLSKDINYCFTAGAVLIPLAFNGLIGRDGYRQPDLNANRSYPGEKCPLDPGTLNLNLELTPNGLYLHTRYSKEVPFQYFLDLAARVAEHVSGNPNPTEFAGLLKATNSYKVTSDETGGQSLEVHWIDRADRLVRYPSMEMSLADFTSLLDDPNCPVKITYEDIDAEQKRNFKTAATVVAGGLASVVGLSALVSALRKRAERGEVAKTANAPLPDAAPPPPPSENVSVKILPAEVLFDFERKGLYSNAPESARFTQDMFEWLDKVFNNSKEKRSELRQLLRVLDCELNNYNVEHGTQITLSQLAEMFPRRNLGFVLNFLTGKKED